MRNLRKPCSIIHSRRNHGFYGRHFEIGHNHQLHEESSIGNLNLTQWIYLNQMVPSMETFVQKRTCCHKLYAKNEKKGGMLLQNYIIFYYFV